MTYNKKTTLLQRLRKAASSPIIMAAIAGVSYFAGLKQNNSSSESLVDARNQAQEVTKDPLDGIRSQIGEIKHITMVGEKGKFDCRIASYWIRHGEKARTMRMILTNGSDEIKLAYDYGTNDGILKSSGGISMYVNKDGEWVPGNLTTDQEEYLDRKSNDSGSVRLYKREFDKKTANSSNEGVIKKVVLDQKFVKCVHNIKDF